jgi:transcriptional regulator with XRE-family HTH domain
MSPETSSENVAAEPEQHSWDWLAAFRHQAELTQADFARATGYSRVHISKLETGAAPISQAFIERLAALESDAVPALSDEWLAVAEDSVEPRAKAKPDTSDRISAVQMRALRLSRKMTQTQLAEYLGVSKSYLSHVEAGRTPITDTLLGKLGQLSMVPMGESEKHTPEHSSNSYLEMEILAAAYAHMGKLLLIAETTDIPVPELVSQGMRLVLEEYEIDPRVQLAYINSEVDTEYN